MTWLYRIAAGLALLAAAFAAGWFSRPPVVKTETKVQTVEVEKEVVKTVTRVVTKPDGTVTKETEQTRTADNTTTTDRKEKTKEPAKPSPVAIGTVARRNWSVGVQWQPEWREPSWRPSVGEVGYRAAGDFWITGAYDWKNNHALVGVRYEW